MKLLIFCILFMVFSAQAANITFSVKVPENTPPGTPVYIVGNHTTIGNWDPGCIRMKETDAHMYEKTVTLPDGYSLEYKFTKGSWNTVEKSKNFTEVENRILKVKKDVVIKCSVAAWADIQPREIRSTRTGNITEHRIKSRILNANRTYLVYLPPDYEKTTKKYPVLYLLDGNNMFDCQTAFGGIEWRFDESLESLIAQKKIPPVIAVAVYNSPDRIAEYTFSRDKKRKEGGNADNFMAFMTNELIPSVEKNYRAASNRKHRAIIGSSLGGLLSLYSVYNFNDTFSHAGVVSPSLWWNNYDIHTIISIPPRLPVKIWLDMGTLEGDIDNTGFSDALQDARNAKDILLKTGFILKENLYYFEAYKKKHNESAWAERVPDMLEFLLSDFGL